MADFDPELYLRLIGERELVLNRDDPQHARMNGRDVLGAAAAALATLGAIGPEEAAEISDAYHLAAVLRNDPDQAAHHLRRTQRQSARSAAVPFSSRRVFSSATTVAVSAGELTLHWGVLSEQGLRFGATLRFDTPRGPHSMGLRSLTVTGPDGVSTRASFSGSSGEHQASGHFQTDSPLPLDAAWLEIDGARIDLPASVTPAAVELEPIAGQRTALRYLWQLMADFGGHHRPGAGVEAAIHALVAAGLIQRDEPELEAIRWVNGERRGQPRRTRRLRASPTNPATAIPPLVPAAWRALLSGSRPTTGPEGTIAIGAATPVFDGIALAVNALQSEPDGFALAAETSGVPHPHPMPDSTFRQLVAWWATDDRGNRYLGHTNGWGGSDQHCEGTIGFGPLDARARELTLEVSTLDTVARIRVPLDWPQ